jgi:ferritin-like metal-binding protein YciE
MDTSPDVLAEQVRLKRSAIDNDLELLRLKVQNKRPTRDDAVRWAQRVAPVVAGSVGLWWWTKRRHAIDSLDELLTHALSDLYQSEQQTIPSLHRLAERASDPELRSAFIAHAKETAVHVERLERVFRAISRKPKRRRRSEGIAGLIDESDRLLHRKIDPDVRDAWLIASAQRIEHVEISGYGTARTYAEMLGFERAAQLLQETLDEERAADEKLTRIARRFINPQALGSAGAAGF